ncbi:MAG: class I SAM-dependent methyltransferase [Candidatus Paceibacterota bacterium]|jgi:ubiquinone/menaquinone biosynthesis C-methylase UbiE
MKIKDNFLKILFKKIDLKNKRVLEIGCGDGFRTKQISKNKGVKIIAIDPDKKNILSARKNFSSKNIKYIILNAENLAFKLKSFDVVIFTLSLHHMKSPKKALIEVNRVLKEGGNIVIIEPGFHGPFFDAEIMFDCFDGDERDKKEKTYKLIMKDSKIKNKKEFFSKTEWSFNSLSDFNKNMKPKKNIKKVKEFLEENNYKLWGERRINIFSKI